MGREMRMPHARFFVLGATVCLVLYAGVDATKLSKTHHKPKVQELEELVKNLTSELKEPQETHTSTDGGQAQPNFASTDIEAVEEEIQSFKTYWNTSFERETEKITDHKDLLDQNTSAVTNFAKSLADLKNEVGTGEGGIMAKVIALEKTVNIVQTNSRGQGIALESTEKKIREDLEKKIKEAHELAKLGFDEATATQSLLDSKIEFYDRTLFAITASLDKMKGDAAILQESVQTQQKVTTANFEEAIKSLGLWKQNTNDLLNTKLTSISDGVQNEILKAMGNLDILSKNLDDLAAAGSMPSRASLINSVKFSQKGSEVITRVEQTQEQENAEMKVRLGHMEHVSMVFQKIIPFLMNLGLTPTIKKQLADIPPPPVVQSEL